MAKVMWKPGTMMSPLPPALITSGNMKTKNVMTAAWTGIICSEPVLTYVSIRPSRYTHELISKHKEFVINLPTWEFAAAVDTVGVKSGRDIDKFALTGLTAEPSSKVKAPQISECPISMECKVLEVRNFGTHDMFLAEVVAVDIDEKYIDKDGALDVEKAGLLAYAHGFYYTLGRKLGKFGFSVEKKRKTTTAKATILKADSKFGKATNSQKFQKRIEEKRLESGVEVVVKKARFKKPAKAVIESTLKKTKKSDKFKQKENKSTNYEPYSFRKKSDGSFKKKLQRKSA